MSLVIRRDGAAEKILSVKFSDAFYIKSDVCQIIVF